MSTCKRTRLAVLRHTGRVACFALAVLATNTFTGSAMLNTDAPDPSTP